MSLVGKGRKFAVFNINRALELRNNGEKMDYIAAVLGVSKNTIRRRLKDHGMYQNQRLKNESVSGIQKDNSTIGI